jgi:hypothetical protein
MIRKVIFIITFFIAASYCDAQELNCQVQVISPTIQATDKTIYETLETSIRDFMNNRKWTQDQFLNQERIECTILINIKNRPSTDVFDATIQITSGRPIYKTSYKAPILNVMDKDFAFRYVQDQTLEFDESQVSTNLTSVLAYYANIIIGFDYDTFSPEGGSLYFTKAQTIVNNAQSLPEVGWKAFESTQNRYWIAENLLNVSFRPLRSTLYKYHRLGLDRMADNVQVGRTSMLESIKDLKKVFNDKPNSYLMQVFFDAKVDEIVNVFNGGTSDEKNQVVPVLNLVDPAHSSKYNTIIGAK